MRCLHAKIYVMYSVSFLAIHFFQACAQIYIFTASTALRIRRIKPNLVNIKDSRNCTRAISRVEWRTQSRRFGDSLCPHHEFRCRKNFRNVSSDPSLSWPIARKKLLIIPDANNQILHNKKCCIQLDHLEDLVIYEKIILKLIFNKWDGGVD
jgi:hypothetical protein